MAMRLDVSVLLLSCLASAGGCSTSSIGPVQAAIGPAGGTLSDDGTTVTIPAGALSKVVTITLTPTPGALGPPGITLVGTPMVLGPEGQTFAIPVSVLMSFDPGKLPAGTSSGAVAIYTAAVGSDSFAALLTTAVDATHVSAQTTHFSIFDPGVSSPSSTGSSTGSSGGASTGSSTASSTDGSSGQSATGSASSAGTSSAGTSSEGGGVSSTGGSSTGTGGSPAGCACSAINGTACCGGGLCDAFAAPGAGTTGGSLEILTSGAQANCLAIDSTYVYWSDARGAILKVPIAGGAASMVTPCLGEAPQGIAVDSENVYFTIPNSGFVMKAALDGGIPAALASSESDPYTLAIDSQYAYWTWNYTTDSVYSGVHWVSLAGGDIGEPFTDLSRQNYTTFDVTAGPTEVGWTSAHALDDGPHQVIQTVGPGGASGGVTETLTADTDWGVTYPYGMTIDSELAYWTEPNFGQQAPTSGCTAPDQGNIMVTALDGGATSVIATATFIADPAAIVSKDGSLYWIEHGSANFGELGTCAPTGLYRLTLDGGGVPELLEASPETIFKETTALGANLCIAADDSSIYWIVGGEVWKAAR